MGYGEVSDVRLGKLIEVTLDDKVPEAEERKRLEEMCKKLLANTVIEDYRIEL
jgi:phosphoribosylformylglycinamidine synthase